MVRPERSLPPEALGSLYQTQADRVYGFLLARCGSPSLAEDLTSATFENAAREFARGRGSAVTSSWLLTVARRRLIDFWRSNERARRRAGQLRNHELLRVSGQTPEEEANDEDVIFALESLSARQRAALALRYLDDYSVHEVAEALNMTYRAAESLLARARRSFVAAYKDNGE